MFNKLTKYVINKYNNFPFPETIDGLMLQFMFLLRFALIGVMPYEAIYTKSKTYIGHTQKFLWKRLIYPIMTYSLIFWAIRQRLEKMENANIIELIGFYYLVVGLNIFHVLCVIVFNLNFWSVVSYQTKVREVDFLFRKLNIIMSYKLIFYLVSGFTVFGPLAVLVIFSTDTPLVVQMYDLICFGIPFHMKDTLISIIFGFNLVLYLRFHTLYNYLEDIEDATPILESAPYENFMVYITEIHEKLIEATLEFNKAFSGILLLHVTYSYIQMLFCLVGLLTGAYKSLEARSLLTSMVFQGVIMVLTYLICFMVEQKAKQIYSVLGLLNICYYDPKIAMQKNTLLLQALHSKVKFTCLGLFPIRLNILLSQAQGLTSYFLLINQYQHKKNL